MVRSTHDIGGEPLAREGVNAWVALDCANSNNADSSVPRTGGGLASERICFFGGADSSVSQRETGERAIY